MQSLYMHKKKLFGHLLALLLGGLIYISFRTKSLAMFQWFESISLDTAITSIRSITMPLEPNLPDWFLFSFPDGLWIFSYISLMLWLWKNDRNPTTIFWIFLLPSIAIVSEVGQLFQLLPGTFDLVDILFYALGTLTPLKIYKPNIPTFQTNTK